MTVNADITIFNRYLNKDAKKEEYRATVIRGVHYHTEQKVSVKEKGLASADLYKVRIPKDADTDDKEYISPEEYRHLDLNEVEGYWTIDNGDYFVQDVCDEEIATPEIMKHAARVVSCSVNLQGMNPHYRIGGA